MEKKSLTLSEKTASILYNLIVNEEQYLPGERLPSEPTLSAELGVSRTTLREAIRSLVAQGVLEVRRGAGTFVSDNISELQGPDDFIRLENLRIQAKDLYELRLIFEPAVAKIACERAQEDERHQVITLGERVTDLIRNGQPWQEADRDFHQAIVRAAHNNFFTQLLPLIHRAFLNGIAVADNEALARIPILDNPDICYAFRVGDTDLAEVAMSLHIKHVMQLID